MGLFGICFVGRHRCCWSMIVGFGFTYLTPFVFLLTRFNLLVSLSVEGFNRMAEGRKETKITFNSKFYFRV